jgi:predicted deacetylase
MNWRVWDETEAFLCREGIQPMLAVVPDNQDNDLRVSPVNADFWNRAREWQHRGWTIGMHGWQHRFVTTNAGILQVNAYSEFAGLSEPEQRRKLRSGAEIFSEQGIVSSLWIAPAHSFDAATLQLLPEFGFRCISDGYSSFPFLDDSGMLWIPQQLWSFRWRPFGVWTICFHINRWTDSSLSAFKENVARFRKAITDFTAVTSEYGTRRESFVDALSASAYRFAAEIKSSIGQSSRTNASIGRTPVQQ